MADENEWRHVTGSGKNSILIGICTALMLAVLGWGGNWLGNKVVEGNDKLTKIETALPFIQQTVNRLENQINNLVTKPELEATKQEIKNDNLKFQNEILRSHNRRNPEKG